MPRVFPSLEHFLERATIAAPRVRIGHSIQALLAGSESQAVYEYRPSAAEADSDSEALLDDVRRRFIIRFGRWVLDWPKRTRSLAEYEALLFELRHLKTQKARLSKVLSTMRQARPMIRVGDYEYKIPDPDGLDLVEPAEVARVMLSQQWGLDRQAIRETIARMRKERPIAEVWQRYLSWLNERPPDLLKICRSLGLGSIKWPNGWPVPSHRGR